MSTMQHFIIFLLILKTSLCFFDVEEFKTMNYGIDIKNEPVSMKESGDTEEDISRVRLTSKYGQLYQCTFPNAVDQEKQKGEAEKEALDTGIPDLLKPMESSPCLRKTKDWWSYEFCYGKYIKQFHLADDGRIEGDILVLGYFESDYNWDGVSSQSELKPSSLQRYHTQQYVNGTKCDLNQKMRKTEVRFVCEEGTADYIHGLDEPETCSYIMTIHTMRICHHPFMMPPTPTQTVSITCNPLLSDAQYQDYLQHLEAKEAAEKAEREKEEELQRQKTEAELEERRRLAGEKAKYYRENQIIDDGETQEGSVEVEGSPDEVPDVEGEITEVEEPDLSEQWNSILKAARDTGDDSMPESKTMFKVISSPEEFKDFLKEAMEEVKKLNIIEAKDTEITGKGEKEEEDEEVKERRMNIPPPINENERHTGLEKLGGKKADSELEDPELEELDQEIRTLKEKYKTRKQKLTEYKQKVKSNMAQQYEAIIKEAKEELAQEGLETDVETRQSREAIRHLTKTIDSLLDRLDKTQQDINAVDKELEQFAEYDEEEKVKSVPPVRDDTPPTPPKQAAPSEPTGPDTKVEGHTEGIRVKVSKIPKGQRTKVMANALGNEHTEALENSVKRELEKAGFGNGDKIQVKIITTAYDSNDDTLHVLSDQESEAFRNMIVDMISGKRAKYCHSKKTKTRKAQKVKRQANKKSDVRQTKIRKTNKQRAQCRQSKRKHFENIVTKQRERQTTKTSKAQKVKRQANKNSDVKHVKLWKTDKGRAQCKQPKCKQFENVVTEKRKRQRGKSQMYARQLSTKRKGTRANYRKTRVKHPDKHKARRKRKKTHTGNRGAIKQNKGKRTIGSQTNAMGTRQGKALGQNRSKKNANVRTQGKHAVNKVAVKHSDRKHKITSQANAKKARKTETIRVGEKAGRQRPDVKKQTRTQVKEKRVNTKPSSKPKPIRRSARGKR